MSLVGFLPVHLQGFYGWLIFVRSWIYLFGIRNRIEPKIDNILRKNKMASEETKLSRFLLFLMGILYNQNRYIISCNLFSIIIKNKFRIPVAKNKIV